MKLVVISLNYKHQQVRARCISTGQTYTLKSQTPIRDLPYSIGQLISIPKNQ